AAHRLILSNLHLEKRIIRMFVTPPEILLLRGLDLAELTVVPVLLPEVDAVCAIFLLVVHMIVPAFPITVAFVMVVISLIATGAMKTAPNKNPLRIKRRFIL